MLRSLSDRTSMGSSDRGCLTSIAATDSLNQYRNGEGICVLLVYNRTPRVCVPAVCVTTSGMPLNSSELTRYLGTALPRNRCVDSCASDDQQLSA